MAYAPIFRVYIDNDEQRDISQFIESFRYEDSFEEDNMLRLTVFSEVSETLSDDDEFLTGTILSFQFGYLQGEMSEIHRCRITDIQHDFGTKVTMSLTCLDLGTTIKKVTSGKIWSNVTSIQIAQSIASKYGLELEFDATTKVWSDLPQGNRDDFDFLRYLTQRESGGDYIVYIRNTTMYFVKRGLDRDSLMTFTYGDGNGRVIKFSASIKESSQMSASNASIVSTVDGLKAEANEQLVDAESEAEDATTGKYKRLYNENGVEIEGVEKLIVDATDDKQEANNLGNSIKKQGTLKSVQGKLKIIGSPLMTPNNVITMNGVTNRYSGNWFVTKVVHAITRGGYLTDMALDRNGSKKRSSVEAEKNNGSIGPDTAQDEVKVRVYDENSNLLGYSSTNRNAKKANNE